MIHWICTAKNLSEHFPVKCTIDFNVEYFNGVG